MYGKFTSQTNVLKVMKVMAFANTLDRAVGMPVKILYGHCHLQLPVVVLSSWLPWLRITTSAALVPSD